MPAAFDKVSLSMPQGWALQAWKVTLGGAPLNEVIVPAVVLVALGLGFFAIGAIFFRRRFA
jgi:ABC-type multidrug transport system permease subunit